MKRRFFSMFSLFLTLFCSVVNATNQPVINIQEPGYWQQHVDYKMNVNMDVKKYQYKGTQELIYTNNSPDTLKKVFFHLYPNAFQPGSAMDMRLQTITDPDKRMVRKFTKDKKDLKER